MGLVTKRDPVDPGQEIVRGGPNGSLNGRLRNGPGQAQSSGERRERMRTLIAAVIVGLALGVLTTAALACNDDAFKSPPQDNSPQVQQPQPGNST